MFSRNRRPPRLSGLCLPEVALPEVAQHRLEANLRLIDAIGCQIARAEAEIAERFASDTLIAAPIVAAVWELGG
jgi:hypothetical protein